MRRRAVLAALSIAPFAGMASEPVRVVTSFSILADMIRQVSGDAVRVEALVGPDGDVHVYEPRPKDLHTLLASALLVRNGLGLEGWMDRLTGAAGFRGTIVVAAEKVTPRTMKGANGGALSIDPHAWQDPMNGILYAQVIAGALALVDAPRAAAYQDGATRYARQIGETDAWIAEVLGSIPEIQRRIITTHDAFGYFGARYGVEFLSAEGISTDSEPSAKTIAALVRQIEREKVRAVFIENMTNPKLAEMLARETGAVLGGTVYSDALSASDGPAATYLEMMRYNTTLFASAMRGNG